MEQGGSKANKTGNQLESFVRNILNQYSYELIPKDKFKESCQILNQKLYTEQMYICDSIYGTKINGDFVIYHPAKHPICLAMECKWQQSGGSVDEKYPYLVANIKEKYPYPTIILIDGGGYKKQAKQWLVKQIDNKKLLGVFGMSEFQKWVNQENI